MSKIKIKNSFPHLLSAAMEHKDCPEWLRDKVWNALNDNSDVPPCSTEQLNLFLIFSKIAPETECFVSELITPQ